METASAAPAIVVFCEGETEATLLEQFKRHWRIPDLQVESLGCDPSFLVEQARRRQTSEGSGNVEVWVVFDKDEHKHWPDAIDRAQTCSIGLAISNPCFELWGMLLHQDQTAYIDRHAAQRKLGKLHVGYRHKGSPYLQLKVVLANLDIAKRRGERLCQLAISDGDALRNPTTTFSDLVTRIMSRARR